MKALSLQPPWGMLVCANLKDCENRSWRSSFKGEVLIHQSKRWDSVGFDKILEIDPDAYKWVLSNWEQKYSGAIIGKATFGECTDFIKSKWFFGKYAYPVSNGILLTDPLPYKGRLNFFEVDSDNKKLALEITELSPQSQGLLTKGNFKWQV